MTTMVTSSSGVTYKIPDVLVDDFLGLDFLIEVSSDDSLKLSPRPDVVALHDRWHELFDEYEV